MKAMWHPTLKSRAMKKSRAMRRYRSRFNSIASILARPRRRVRHPQNARQL